MHDHARRLVDDDQVLVFEEDFQRNLFRPRGLAGNFRQDDPHPLPGADAIGRLSAMVVDRARRRPKSRAADGRGCNRESAAKAERPAAGRPRFRRRRTRPARPRASGIARDIGQMPTCLSSLLRSSVLRSSTGLPSVLPLGSRVSVCPSSARPAARRPASPFAASPVPASRIPGLRRIAALAGSVGGASRTSPVRSASRAARESLARDRRWYSRTGVDGTSGSLGRVVRQVAEFFQLARDWRERRALHLGFGNILGKVS